jgi:hypothetical protein
MSFSISSPDLEVLASRMEHADPVNAYHAAATEVGEELEKDIAAAFRGAGAEDDLIDAVGTYIHKDGTAYVGIPGSSPHAATAHDIEYGTPTIPPRAPVRNAAAARSYDIGQRMAEAIDRTMGEELQGKR